MRIADTEVSAWMKAVGISVRARLRSSDVAKTAGRTRSLSNVYIVNISGHTNGDVSDVNIYMTAEPPGTYHHGDLAVTLMDLALQKISEEGTERLSLRGLAREAGVSPAAPYRHFPSKRCLLAALATRGFRELLGRVQAQERLSENLEQRLMNLGRAYLGFALDHPTTYQIMFGTIVDDFSEYADLAAAAEASYAPVLAAMAALIERHPHWEMTPVQLGGVTWAAVHGIASLVLFRIGTGDRQSVRLTTRSLDALQADTDTALRLLMQGVLHPPGVSPT